MPKNATVIPTSERKIFSKIREAREAIQDRAVELLELYINNIKLAQAEGHFEVAQKSLEWLMAHTPPDASGVRAVDSDIDKRPKGGDDGHRGPQINIGFAIGGLNDKPKALPAAAEVIEVEPDGTTINHE